MNTESKNIQAPYSAPEMCVIDARIEGIICESGTGTIAPWEPDPNPLGIYRVY